jgi:hypothetical protein
MPSRPSGLFLPPILICTDVINTWMVVLQLTAKLIASTMTTSTSPECFFLVVALMRAKRKVRVAWTHLRATTVPVRALLQACR